MVLLLLVFVGQVAASTTISCLTDPQQQSIEIDHSTHVMSNHANESSSSSALLETPFEDCCAENPDCSMSGCLLFALPTFLKSSEVVFSTQNFELPINLALSQSLTYLYRPPILS